MEPTNFDEDVAVLPFLLRNYQAEWIAAIQHDRRTHSRLLVDAPGGTGKCLGRGTPVLLFDGRVKPVESIIAGDVLIGPDSLPRLVRSICSGMDGLYRVTPTKGMPYVVNSRHILSLKSSSGADGLRHDGVLYAHGDVINISVSDFLAQRKAFHHSVVGWRSAVNSWSSCIHPDMPPYILGFWLGDGTTGEPHFTVGDGEPIAEIEKWASAIGSRVVIRNKKPGCCTVGVRSIKQGWFKNRMASSLLQLGVLNKKFIPVSYKIASRADRLELLAGLIDSDGSLTCGGYDFISISESISNDVVFIARSVGLAAYMKPCHKKCQNGNGGIYFRVSISGDCSIIPCRIARKKCPPRKQVKNVLHIGIRVEPIGLGEYFGFTVEGPDHLFLLGDFTVTHNSTFFAALAHKEWTERGGRTLIIENRDKLVRQSAERIRNETGLECDIEMADQRASPYAPIVVASIATLGRMNRLTSFQDTHFSIVVIDECFPAGTLVDGRPIESIKVGDYVKSYNHSNGKLRRRRVARLFKSRPSAMCAVILCDGRRIVCTPYHPFYSFTRSQYIPASLLTSDDMVASITQHDTETIDMFRVPEAVHVLHEASAIVCQERREGLLLRAVQVIIRLAQKLVGHGKNKPKVCLGENDRQQPDGEGGCSGQGKHHASGHGMGADSAQGQWDGCHGASNANGVSIGVGDGGCRPDTKAAQIGIPNVLQVRCWEQGPENRRGGGREQSSYGVKKSPGHKEGCALSFVGVDRVEIYQQTGGGGFGELCPDGFVYNIEVERNHNYFANGILVHNCHHSCAPLHRRAMDYFYYGSASLAEGWKPPLDGTFTPKCLIVGTTATPDIGAKRNLGSIYQKFAVRYSYLNAIEDGWLVGLVEKNIPVRIDTRKFRVKRTGQGMDFSPEDESAALVPVIEELAEQIVGHARDRKTMAFLPSLECAKMMADALNRRGLKAIYVSGVCLDKDEKTQEFADHGPGICACLCALYVEGADFPDVDCVAWMRATISEAFYKQGLFRSTRVLPGIVSDDMTAEERRAAIAKSAKPHSLIISPFFISDRIDICSVHNLFVDAELLSAAKKKPTDMTDPSKIRDFIEALRKAANKHAHKQARTIDPVTYSLSIGDDALANYEPETAADAQPATTEELDFLLTKKIDTTQIRNSGQAQKLIRRIMERENLGLASPGQLTFLHKLGIPDNVATTMKKGQAGAIIGKRTAEWHR